MNRLKKIISGGQTGVDRAALDVAINQNIPYGGWCPKGRIDELGIIPLHYDQLKEIDVAVGCEQENYDTRTQFNIHDADGTLIIIPDKTILDKITDGTVVTINEVFRQKKPHYLLSLSLSHQENTSECMKWIKQHNIKILNVAGLRESSSKGIYEKSYRFLNHLVLKLTK
ncbi:putative molybdenum carrier protein [Legionella worsleiensis]|uniref:Putative molybdenum carrier n=1 Tax=Legionella worsleiensis TaxID=45076 RepID=A0A0W1AJU8_9GAMM|nr:putative molybdenum carrier protein [Legionella worsleiensis]KTD81601.1 putative molybdenum carrier [Legionella worsleiensis]STY31991.1 Putative molybdenum carrier [Legionella worsleiensis]